MLPVERLLAWRPAGLLDRVRVPRRIDGRTGLGPTVVHRVLPIGRYRSLDDYVAAAVALAAVPPSTSTPSR